MHKKLILTSILAISVTGAAHAATNTGSFPNDGKMLEDWTYTNAANETNVGTDGGNVNALANYTWNEIALPAGKYLPADTDGIAANLANCTAGNYCAGTGANTVHYNQSQAQGLTACPSGYGNSALGSTADTDCYRTCNINNMTTTSNPNGTIANIAHAATLTGNDYYGNGTDTCEPATCETGYQVKPGLNLMTAIGASYEDYADASVATNNDGEPSYGNPSIYGIGSDNHNAFAVDYGDRGVIRGHGQCSTTGPSSNPFVYDENNDTYTYNTSLSGVIVNNLTDQTGQSGAQYCYCQLDSYTPYNGTMQSVSGSSVFLYYEEINNYEECMLRCASVCADILGNGASETIAFRAAMFNSATPSLASCEPKTYIITWADTLAADVTANEAATATYGGNINTPVKIDPSVFQTTQKGKRFIGWTFEQQPSNP